MGELEKLQTEAAKRFLQTVLIVDDRASFSPLESKEPEPVDPEDVVEPTGPNLGDVALAAGESSQAPAESEEGDEEDGESYEKSEEVRASEVDVKLLADRFADLEGLTCGTLKPTKEQVNDEVTNRIVRAARGVDIVVIDWMLEDPDFTAKEAIAGIVAAEPKDRRLLAVYTTQRDLGKIAEEILDAIPAAKQIEGDDLAIDAGGIRIVLYHKGGPTLEPEYEKYLCPEEDLPEKLIADFVGQTAGLVPAVALSALAATRENAHRLLGRLHQGLDLGYLGHLLRLADRDEGKQHLLDAISGEFRAVVEDDESTGKVATEGFDAWLKDHESQLRVPMKGLKKLGEALGDKKKKEKWREEFGQHAETKLTTLLVPDQENDGALKSDAEFAELLALRRPYSGQDPALHLGTIVRELEDPKNYWLCIQPVCDSVRLPEDMPTSFLMLPLDPVKANHRASFVVTVPGDSERDQVFLYLWDESSDLEPIRLRPNHRDRVAFKSEDGRAGKVVTTEEGLVLTWVAQLKPAHASRVAHAYGMKLSRVGLDESEWLRKLARDGKKPKQAARAR